VIKSYGIKTLNQT